MRSVADGARVGGMRGWLVTRMELDGMRGYGCPPLRFFTLTFAAIGSWYFYHNGSCAVVVLPAMKPCEFIGSSKADISSMPQPVKNVFGFAIRAAQRGLKHPDAKPLKGFGGAGVLEVVENFDGDTYRAVYTVKFAGMIYVLHVFQKKSKRGAKTPKSDLDLIKSRLKDAEKKYKAIADSKKSD